MNESGLLLIGSGLFYNVLMDPTKTTSPLTILVGTGLLVVLIGIALAVGLWLALTSPGPKGEGARIWIEKGQGLFAISESLEEHKLVHSARFFRLATRLSGRAGHLPAGEFDVPHGLSLLEITDHLAHASPVSHLITFPEGATSADILRALLETSNLETSTLPNVREGAYLPETYSYSRGERVFDVLSRMRKAMDETLIDLWEGRADGLPFDSPDDALILASIVEKETGVSEERAKVASVFINRVRRGMRLQSDPTVIYGRTLGDPLGRAITRSDLADDNPYNTYKINGLPPTPIANPGRASLEAVMNPADTDYLYFVADGSGGHAFAQTLEEHNKNVALWRAIERARRISRE